MNFCKLTSLTSRLLRPCFSAAINVVYNPWFTLIGFGRKLCNTTILQLGLWRKAAAAVEEEEEDVKEEEVEEKV